MSTPPNAHLYPNVVKAFEFKSRPNVKLLSDLEQMLGTVIRVSPHTITNLEVDPGKSLVACLAGSYRMEREIARGISVVVTPDMNVTVSLDNFNTTDLSDTEVVSQSFNAANLETNVAVAQTLKSMAFVYPGLQYDLDKVGLNQSPEKQIATLNMRAWS